MGDLHFRNAGKYCRLTSLIAATITAILLCTPWEAYGQELPFLSTLFKDVNSVTLYGEFAEIKKSPQLGTGGSPCWFLGVCGAGTEVLWDVTPAGKSVHVELGFGAEYLRGFTGKALGDPFDLHASIKSFPQFGAYLSRSTKWKWLTPYIGGSFGSSELWYAEAYGSDHKQITIKAQTFDYGPVLGVAIGSDWVGSAFAEVGFRARRFPGLEYQVKDTVPSTWPREFDMSGWHVSIGWQFEIKHGKALPSYEGDWVLSSVDGGSLPAILDQAKNPAQPGAGVRREALGGTLRLQDHGVYLISLQERITFLDAQGKPTEIKLLDSPKVELGKYVLGPHDLILIPSGVVDGKGFAVSRLGSELVVSHLEPGHTLNFKKLE